MAQYFGGSPFPKKSPGDPTRPGPPRPTLTGLGDLFKEGAPGAKIIKPDRSTHGVANSAARKTRQNGYKAAVKRSLDGKKTKTEEKKPEQE